MNKQEYLLTCLMEECSEVQKAAAKTLRFGLDDYHPEDPNKTPNWQKIEDEIYDLFTVILLLQQDNIIGSIDLQHPRISKKINKIERFMEYSRNVGALDET